MKHRAVTLGAVLMAVGVGGCARRNVTPPPEAFVTLGGKRAPYRAWAQLNDLCAVDPQQFKGEMDAMTALLADWLGQTSAADDGAWDDEHLALLEEGQRQLPSAMAVQKAALDRTETGRCAFEGLGPAKELNAQALRRLADAEQLVPRVKARMALEKWKTERPQALAGARAQACAEKPKPNAPPVPFFAAEDETARLEWHFCDGALVVATPGNPPAVATMPPAPKKVKKQPDPKTWLEAAAAFPPERISRAPRLLRKVTKHADAAPEPEPEPSDAP